MASQLLQKLLSQAPELLRSGKFYSNIPKRGGHASPFTLPTVLPDATWHRRHVSSYGREGGGTGFQPHEADKSLPDYEAETTLDGIFDEFGNPVITKQFVEPYRKKVALEHEGNIKKLNDLYWKKAAGYQIDPQELAEAQKAAGLSPEAIQAVKAQPTRLLQEIADNHPEQFKKFDRLQPRSGTKTEAIMNPQPRIFGPDQAKPRGTRNTPITSTLHEIQKQVDPKAYEKRESSKYQKLARNIQETLALLTPQERKKFLEGGDLTEGKRIEQLAGLSDEAFRDMTRLGNIFTPIEASKLVKKWGGDRSYDEMLKQRFFGQGGTEHTLRSELSPTNIHEGKLVGQDISLNNYGKDPFVTYLWDDFLKAVEEHNPDYFKRFVKPQFDRRMGDVNLYNHFWAHHQAAQGGKIPKEAYALGRRNWQKQYDPKNEDQLWTPGDFALGELRNKPQLAIDRDVTGKMFENVSAQDPSIPGYPVALSTPSAFRWRHDSLTPYTEAADAIEGEVRGSRYFDMLAEEFQAEKDFAKTMRREYTPDRMPFFSWGDGLKNPQQVRDFVKQLEEMLLS